MTLVHTALLSLRRNLMRSILTTLGIIIGISAVIVMFALGEGAQREVEQQIESLGTNVLMVRAGSTKSGGAKQAVGNVSKLEMSDADAIKRDIAEVVYVGASNGGQAQVVWGNQNWSTGIQGTNTDYLHASNWQIAQGRYFSDSDVRSGAKVALVGHTVAQELFGDAEFALGEVVRVNKVPLTIVGVLKAKGQDMRGFDQDDILIIPISTANRRVLGRSGTNIKRVQRLTVTVDEAQNMDYVSEELERLLNQRHRVPVGQLSAFRIMNLSAMLSTRAEANRVFSMLLAGVAGVSLLVGGIGVMNIMLVSVTERTREIGLRMAVGAKPKHILIQFLIESVTLCVIGALMGVLLSLLVVAILQYGVGWTMALSPMIIAISVVGTALIGIGFGFYPAYKAANLDPIEALRYE
ncbi:ABC transporter permease [Echinimonas agarilytica]|uniref:ABC transporter permease n=1 Tax=Echinimonas agarilytica TaxID=1215918 RepID=A0AA42B788_9GAMM|nr:ABC transporter permease [Echinimonas agarilytica]MCM2679629.1 ABC transporter permease [Echinimonas agarilytica]